MSRWRCFEGKNCKKLKEIVSFNHECLRAEKHLARQGRTGFANHVFLHGTILEKSGLAACGTCKRVWCHDVSKSGTANCADIVKMQRGSVILHGKTPTIGHVSTRVECHSASRFFSNRRSSCRWTDAIVFKLGLECSGQPSSLTSPLWPERDSSGSYRLQQNYHKIQARSKVNCLLLMVRPLCC